MKTWQWIVLALVILWLISKSQSQTAAVASPAAALAPTHPLSDLVPPVNNFFEQGGTDQVIYIQGTPTSSGSGGSSGGSSGGGGGASGGGGSTGGGTGRLR